MTEPHEEPLASPETRAIVQEWWDQRADCLGIPRSDAFTSMTRAHAVEFVEWAEIQRDLLALTCPLEDV